MELNGLCSQLHFRLFYSQFSLQKMHTNVQQTCIDTVHTVYTTVHTNNTGYYYKYWLARVNYSTYLCMHHKMRGLGGEWCWVIWVWAPYYTSTDKINIFVYPKTLPYLRPSSSTEHNCLACREHVQRVLQLLLFGLWRSTATPGWRGQCCHTWLHARQLQILQVESHNFGEFSRIYRELVQMF